MKRILITGGAGFIGSHLANKLLEEKNQVVVIDNFDNYYPKKFKLENIKIAKKNPGYLFYPINILNKKKLTSLFSKHHFDTIIHLAAKAGVRPSILNPETYEKVNVQGTLNILELMKKNKIKKLIFASSSSVYGKAKIPYAENSMPHPLSPYGATKLAAESLCYVYHQLYNLNIIILRFFSVYGPSGRPDMAPYLFTDKLYKNLTVHQFGNGNSARDWTYIDDIVNGITKSVHSKLTFEIINLGNNQPVKLKQLFTTIEKHTGKKLTKRMLPIRKEEPPVTIANINKARKLLGWKPTVSFNEGMTKFINWFKANRT